MNELWWLILPIAAGIGALISKYHTPQQRFPADYFKGLRYLLNEQPDKAIDVFTRLLDVDAETADTQLALGALFRKRGEVDRAIVLHQKLLSQNPLPEQQRQLLLIELGEDYLSAGLLDRAEQFSKNSAMPKHIAAMPCNSCLIFTNKNMIGNVASSLLNS